MGQAKRRRLAGAFPAEDFKAPAGSVTITADVDGWLSSMALDAAKIADVDIEIERQLKHRWPGLGYGAIVRGLAEKFVAARKKDDDSLLAGRSGA